MEEIKEDPYWKVKKKWVSRVLVYGSILTIIILLLDPFYSGYGDRARLAPVILSVSAAHSMISEKLIENPNAPINEKDIPLPEDGSFFGNSKSGEPIILEHRSVSDAGIIRLIVSGIPAYLEFTPYFDSSEELNWKCSGKPKKLFSSTCRE